MLIQIYVVKQHELTGSAQVSFYLISFSGARLKAEAENIEHKTQLETQNQVGVILLRDSTTSSQYGMSPWWPLLGLLSQCPSYL